MNNNIELLHLGNTKFEKNQLVISEETTLEEWKNLGHYLSQVRGNVQFWIGDWARFGAKKGYYTNSEVYDELEEITGLERCTIKQYKWVAESTSSNRLDDLSFTHHIEVAKLSPPEQVYFLNKALQEKLSVRELRLQITHNSDTPGKSVSYYDNNMPFPIRLKEWHLKLQEEAFQMQTTIGMRIICIIREHFERKEGKFIST